MKSKKSLFFVMACLLAAGVMLSLVRAAQVNDRPPEYTEFRNIMRMSDASTRLMELEKLTASYPQSRYSRMFEMAIIRTKVSLAADLSQILALHGQVLDSVKGFDRLAALVDLARELMDHPKLPEFEANAVTAAVLGYVEQGQKLAGDEEFMKTLSEEERRAEPLIVQALLQVKALAFLHSADTAGAAAALEECRAKGGEADSDFSYAQGKLFSLQGKEKEALELFMKAAVENFRDSATLARGLYIKTTGSADGFEARLEALQRELPFPIQPRRTGSEWKGKAVLVELFTGSECPPCAGADLGLDGLLEAYESKALAVLVYHLPIPRPDPMMNHAAQRRATHYGVNSTPTIFFDGEAGPRGGGPRVYGEMFYKAYSEEVGRRLNKQPDIKIGLVASLKGDSVNVLYTLDKVPANADFHFALVQEEEKFAGGNGILFHHMVVKEFITLDAPPKTSGNLAISLTASEAAAMKHVSDYEQRGRFTFPERHTSIARKGLRIVFFVQDKASNNVLNSVVVPVK